jgi:nitroimidazol reductase NimA-like FMN-containing flavoprotein (pyridoxamine 5'-phosphate oxidase superfamily)
MHANAGDRIVVKGHHVGEPDRDAEILEVHGANGTPPYVVRWSDDGHEGLFFPGPDATVQHFRAGKPALVPSSDTSDKEAHELSLHDCLDFLDAHRVGRIAILTDTGPVIVPVNYRLVRSSGLNWIAFRTRLGGLLDRTSTHVAFEIDHIDDAARSGWSVLVRGTLHDVDPDAAEFRDRFDSEPWVVDRDSWMIVQPYRIEGRRLDTRPSRIADRS